MRPGSPARKSDDVPSTERHADAIKAIQKEINRSKQCRDGMSGMTGASGGHGCLAVFEYTQFMQWMTTTLEGCESLRSNNDSDSEEESDSDA